MVYRISLVYKNSIINGFGITFGYACFSPVFMLLPRYAAKIGYTKII